MPSSIVHYEIAQMFGIDRQTCRGVNEIIESGNEESQWGRVEELIKLKDSPDSTTIKEIMELIREKWWFPQDHCRKNIPCFFFKAQTAYDNFGVNGLKAYFLHHTVDYADWWQNPPEPYFLLKVRLLPEMTRKEERKLLSYIKQKLFKYNEFSLRPVSQNIYLVCFHLLDDSLFDISGSFEESSIKYRFNERTESLLEDVFKQVRSNFSEVLQVIYEEGPDKSRI